jgi:AraC family transcriptional regulator
MLTYSLASNAARRVNFDEVYARAFNDSRPGPGVKLLRIDGGLENGGQPANGRARPLPDPKIGRVNSRALEIAPANVVSRRASAWDGIRVEVVQFVTHDKIEVRFRAPCHLLLVYEEGVRDEGETVVGDLPPSTLRTLRRKLTFVPAGHEYREWQRPRVRSRVICFYLDPAKMSVYSGASATGAPLGARLFFENNVLWETAVKLAIAIEDGCEPERYCEALAVVVGHELVHMQGNLRRRRPPTRAAWLFGSSASSPPTSKSTSPKRYHSMRWRSSSISVPTISAAPSNNPSAFRRTATTSIAASNARRHCWGSGSRQ